MGERFPPRRTRDVAAVKYRLRLGDDVHDVEVERLPDGRYRVALGGRERVVTLRQIGADLQRGLYDLLVDGEAHQLYADRTRSALELLLDGDLITVEPLTAGTGGAAAAAGSGPATIRAAMTGVIKEVYVQPEQHVERGERLLVLEAMKMNNEVRAPRAGTVRTVAVASGQRIDKGEVLAVIE